MVKLSEFIGEMVSDISDARRIADSNSIAMSQSYHADPFLKGMPVPHYTIQEAEIKVPVSVNKVTSNLQNNDLLQPIILSTIKLKLPQLLTNKFINFYIRRMEKEQQKAKEEQEIQEAVNELTGSDNDKKIAANKTAFKNILPDFRISFNNASNKITKNLAEYMKEYLNSSNFEFVKLLDIKDKLVELLTCFITDEFSNHSGDNIPYSEEDLPLLAEETGREMFFEFKQRSESEKGLFIEPNTSKLNEYVQKDNLLFMTIKIREQDLDIVVEEGVDGEQRFLSLN
ncbi:MAG: hypothetical protein HDT25_10550 [Ruminococcus sp.]|nr:hypothetical protein [Ruminococcus sp.]